MTMAQTCQHCGAATDDDTRVMCPSCGRRMRPSQPAAAQPPAPPAPPESPAPSPPGPPQPAPSWPAAPQSDPYAPAYGEPGSPSYGQPPDPAWAVSYPSAEPPRPQLYVSRRAQASTSRATVAFRIVLAIPHLVAWWAIGYAAGVVSIVAWFAALFTARVPTGIYGFIAWYVSYSSRVWAYVNLLTDRWPVFSDNEGYPVAIWLPGPQRLNRAAVFFRFILAIPAGIVGALVTAGMVIASPVVWLVVLIAGRVPRPLFNASAAAVRFQLRHYSYSYLLTPAYPAGLYGDPPDRREEDEAPAEAPPPAEAADVPPPPPDAPRPPVLHRSARRLVTLFIVLGCVAIIGYTIGLIVLAGGVIDRAQANNSLSIAYGHIHTADASACTTAADRFGCLKEQARQDANEFSKFDDEVRDIDFPSDVQPQVDALHSATETFVADFRALSTTTSLAEFRAFTQTHDMGAEGQAVDLAVQALSKALLYIE